MNLLERTLEAIPAYHAFLTIDELDASSRRLAATYPDLVELTTAGHSRDGHPILQLRIGSGRRRALLFGCPHPNEPIGAMMLEYLTWRLCEDPGLRRELDYTWYIIKCIDVDGTRLNEGWFKGPFTPFHYARHFYRPAFHQQVEWTFPIQYKTYEFDRPLPETRALMQAIHEARPDFMYSLHNAGFGGVFYYVSKALPEALYARLRGLAVERQLPLHLGEPEVPYAQVLSQGVYRMPTTRDTYDFYAQVLGGADPAGMLTAGACSLEYAEPVSNPFTLVAEMPYYYDPRVNEPTPTATVRREAVLKGLDRDDAIIGFLAGQYERARPWLQVATRFEEALSDFLEQMGRAGAGRRHWSSTNQDLARPATVAELFDTEVQSLFYRLLYFGVFLRMLAPQPPHPVLAEVREVVAAEMERWWRHLDGQLNYTVVPIRDLVSVQLGAALLVMEHLQKQR